VRGKNIVEPFPDTMYNARDIKKVCDFSKLET